MNSNP